MALQPWRLRERLWDFLFPPSPAERYLRGTSSVAWKREFPSAKAMRAGWLHAVFSYRDPRVRTLVWLIKYKQRRELMEKAGVLLLEEILSIQEEGLTISAQSEPWLLVPIPMSRERLRERGANHTELLARCMLAAGGAGFLELATGVLKKVRHTKTQTSLPRAARLQNITNSFAVAKPESVAERKILLLDDVTTTGATLTEARRILLEAGAHQVSAITLAH